MGHAKNFPPSSPHHTTTTTTMSTAATFTPLQTSKWELGVSLVLNFWPALTDAVNSQWGGPESSDKRDWLCGHIADLWESIPDADEFEVESTLLQVMEDEFEVALEDDSAFEVARAIMDLRKKIVVNDFSTVDALHQRFLTKPRNNAPVRVEEPDQEAGSSEDEDGDEEMGDTPAAAAAPAPVQRERERVPEVDEDGFETVRRRK